jgi:hypothetical protein
MTALPTQTQMLLPLLQALDAQNNSWYSIDYAASLWHPAYYRKVTYQPELLDAMRANPAPISTSLALARAIPMRLWTNCYRCCRS